ncbi:Vacuolar protein-sorting-associated protein 25 [Sorochytrium milnesiophthora]
MHNFPPFYTKQKNADVYRRQSEVWRQLILAYCAKHRIFVLDVSQSQASELFHNQTIQRRVSQELLTALLDDLVAAGSAEWVDVKPKHAKMQCLVKWKSVDEWAECLYKWVYEHGMTDSVMTGYELLRGDLTEGEEFFEMDDRLFRKAVASLVQQRRAQTFANDDEDTVDRMGIKFLSK